MRWDQLIDRAYNTGCLADLESSESELELVLKNKQLNDDLESVQQNNDRPIPTVEEQAPIKKLKLFK